MYRRNLELSQRTFTEIMRKVTRTHISSFTDMSRNVISVGIRGWATGLGHLFDALNNCKFVGFKGIIARH